MSEIIRTGEVINVFPEQKITANFTKRVLWLKTDEQYPQTLEIQFVNQNVDLLDNFSSGDRAEVTFGVNGKLNGKGGEDRVFNSLTGYRIIKK